MQRTIYIESYECMTGVSKNSEELWSSLSAGRSGVAPQSMERWAPRSREYFESYKSTPIASLIKDDLKGSALDTLVTRLLQVFKKACFIKAPDCPVGIIYSSTKGAIEDHLSLEGPIVDSLDIVLNEFLEKAALENIVISQSVSNACASSHGALALGKKWIEAGLCERVHIISGDIVGPFIQTGFKSLKALSAESCRPFQKERDGLILGEAICALTLSSFKSDFELADVVIFNEAHAVTSPSPEGTGLYTCASEVVKKGAPDMAIAHGTATYTNDLIEDEVLSKIQELVKKDFPITAAKWATGHTLGSSGLVDLIAAINCLKHNKIFPIPNAHDQESFKGKNYVYNLALDLPLSSVLVTSLGFGGVNGALLVRRAQ